MTTTVGAAKPTKRPARTRAELERAAWEPFLEFMQQERARMAQAWQELDLTPPQGYLLLKLARMGATPMVGLAGAMACDASNITGIVDKLEARGLIERRPHPEDRRIKMLVVTPEGQQLRSRLFARMAVPPAHFASLSVAELKSLRQILGKAAQAADEEPGPTPSLQ